MRNAFGRSCYITRITDCVKWGETEGGRSTKDEGVNASAHQRSVMACTYGNWIDISND